MADYSKRDRRRAMFRAQALLRARTIPPPDVMECRFCQDEAAISADSRRWGTFRLCLGHAFLARHIIAHL